MTKFPWENLSQKELMQYDILWDNINDNPNFKSNASLSRNQHLETNQTKIISAINEIKRVTDRVDQTVVNFTTFYNELIGNTFEDPTLHANIKKIDENVLKAIYKTYTLVIGDPDKPVDVSELGDNINQCILTLKSLIDIKEAEIKEINNRISDLDGLREAIALEDIEAYKVIYMDDNGMVSVADCNNLEHCDNIVGISVLSAQNGGNLKYCLRGEVTNPDWSFAKKGKSVFIGMNGELVSTPVQNCKFIQEFGFIVDGNTINIDIEDGVAIV